MKSRSLVSCFCALFALVTSLQVTTAFAELKTFTVDQSKSGLYISGTFTLILPFPFTEQAANSLTTSYTGTIEVDITDTNITFVGGSIILGVNNGVWQPGIGGTVGGTAPANYGGRVSAGGAYAAVRDVLFDVTSVAVPITGITFRATNLAFTFPPISNTYIDYSYTISGGGSGREKLTGNYQNAINTNATLNVQGADLVLNVPVDITGTVSALGDDDISYRLRGRIVAKTPAPIVPMVLRIKSFKRTSPTQGTFVIDTTTTKNFTLLSSTNFTTWTTNDQFIATATNTTRVVTLPASGTGTRYFRGPAGLMFRVAGCLRR